jgi:hypothetical protein
MNEKDEVICPWCHTEIVWDPEIGPEEECPHCFNELSDYRSIQLTVKQTGEKLLFGEDTEDDEDLSTAWEDSDEPLDAYGETVQKICDQQEEAPECSICHEFMLYAGDERVEKTFVPHVPEALGKAFLQSSFTMSVYVCPSCFKVDKFLSDADRTHMVDIIKSD